MIKDFSDRETEKIYRQEFSKKLPREIQRVALRKLIMLDEAQVLNDLRVPPRQIVLRYYKEIEKVSSASESTTGIVYVSFGQEKMRHMLRLLIIIEKRGA